MINLLSYVTIRLWRLCAKATPKAPVGLPYMRDPDNRCPIYEPRKRMPGDFRQCYGDGHFLCKECCHYEPEEESENKL